MLRRAKVAAFVAPFVFLIVIACWVSFRIRSSPISAPFVPRVADPGVETRQKGMTIRVLSEDDESPIQGATIRYRRGSGNELSDVVARTDLNGRALIDAGAEGAILVTARGHVGERLKLPFAGVEQTITLGLAGGIELELVDVNQKPVPGLEVALSDGIGPSATEDLLAAPVIRRKESGADGRVLWAEVLPGKYQWLLKSDHYMESLATGRLPDASQPGSLFLRKNSPDFSVEPGEVVKLRAKVFIPAVVRGVVAARAGRPSATFLKLHHRIPYAQQGGTSPVHNTPVEVTAKCGEQGRFNFPQVVPGTKMLTAQWTDGRDRIEFATRRFELAPGEDKDLGIILGQEGHVVGIVVRLVGLERVSFTPREVEVSISFATMARTSPDGVEGTVTAHIDEPVFLQGVPEGQIAIGATVEGEFPDVRWKYKRLDKLKVPSSGLIEIPIEAEALVPVQVAVTYPGDRPTAPVQVYFLPDALEEVTMAGPQMFTSTPGNIARSDCKVPPGGYRVWAIPAPVSRGQVENYFGEARLEAKGAQPNVVTLNLGFGATVEGVTRNRSGKACSRLMFIKPGPHDWGDDPILWNCRSDADGYFILTGLPPNCSFKVGSTDKPFQSGPAGSNTKVELRFVTN